LKNDVWYDWIAPFEGQVVATTCDPGLPPLQQPNTTMCVYQGCDCPVAAGTALDCSFGTFDECGSSARLEFDAIAGECYKFRLGGHVGSEEVGDLRIQIEEQPCPEGPITFLDPPSGVIDARQPHPQDDPAARQGIDTLVVEGPAGLDDPRCLENWTLCETAEDGRGPNAISSVFDNGDGTFTVTLDRTISMGQVTTVTYTDANSVAWRGEFTSLPADVSSDGLSGPVDILAIVDILNAVAVAPWGLYSSDVDHSGDANPADILRVIDLLNGADQFDPWINVSAPPCGTCCPP
jgi:hypothetical protein